MHSVFHPGPDREAVAAQDVNRDLDKASALANNLVSGGRKTPGRLFAWQILCDYLRRLV